MKNPRRTKATHGKWAQQIIVGVATFVAGLLFGISINMAEKKPAVIDVDLYKLVREKQDSITELETNIASTQTKISQQLESEVAAASAFSATDLTGPGVYVALSDAPADTVTGGNVDANDLVVHQGDIDAVLNALRAGDAEAISIQGIRIGPTTPVRCIGNVILIGSSSFAPPYEIEAIGDPDRLRESVLEDPQVRIYMQYSDEYGLGLEVETEDKISIPALPESPGLQYAQASGANND